MGTSSCLRLQRTLGWSVDDLTLAGESRTVDGAIERLFVSVPGDDTLEMPARSVSSSRAAEDISDVRADRGHLVKLSSVVLVNGYGAQAIPDYLALSGYKVFNIGHGLGARRRPFGVI